MKNLDLRQVGTVLGLPLYVELSSIPNIEVQHDPTPLTERDREMILIQAILKTVFKTQVKK